MQNGWQRSYSKQLKSTHTHYIKTDTLHICTAPYLHTLCTYEHTYSHTQSYYIHTHKHRHVHSCIHMHITHIYYLHYTYSHYIYHTHTNFIPPHIHTHTYTCANYLVFRCIWFENRLGLVVLAIPGWTDIKNVMRQARNSWAVCNFRIPAQLNFLALLSLFNADTFHD